MKDPLTEHVIAKSACPNCGKVFDRMSGVGHDSAPDDPDTKAYTVCDNCMSLLVYDKGTHTHRWPTDEEAVEIAGDPELIKLMNAMGAAKAAYEKATGKKWGEKG